MGPVLIFDKSSLQSLNPDEAVWLDHFFLTNITPVFYIETLADLEKEVRGGRTPEQVVGNLAYKTPDLNSKANVHHARLLEGELSGAAPLVPLDRGVPVIGGAKHVRLESERGVYVEPSPEEEALARWQGGQFLDLERQQAKVWRRGLELISPEEQRKFFAGWYGDRCPRTLAEVRAASAAAIDDDNSEQTLRFGLALLGVRSEVRQRALERWLDAGRPPLRTFAPYFRHVLGVEMFFYFGLAAGLISDRRTNHIDLAYLFYLPFCMVFTSNDALHAATVPLFLRPDQTFVPGSELKADLAELDRHYATQPPELIERGSTSWPHGRRRSERGWFAACGTNTCATTGGRLPLSPSGVRSVVTLSSRPRCGGEWMLLALPRPSRVGARTRPTTF